MTDFLFIMWKPLLACLILTGIHAYLGIHVIEREVIFVDLALAQIAALGATIAFLFGFELHGSETYWFSLAATVIGAIIFSLTRRRHEKVPQEAIIGIVYAMAAAAAVLILSRASEGDEHIRQILVGNILLVSVPEIVKMTVLYTLVMLFHGWFRKTFMLISTNPEGAFERGISVRTWDLLFYLTFGLVVTSSVQIAGVLLVFSFLIVPAVGAILFSSRLHVRLVLGWIFGVVASFAGIYLSYHLDLPTGAAIVCTFGGLLLFLALLKSVFRFNI
jgi:zinc/manganese transport system permease protein